MESSLVQQCKKPNDQKGNGTRLEFHRQQCTVCNTNGLVIDMLCKTFLSQFRYQRKFDVSQQRITFTNTSDWSKGFSLWRNKLWWRMSLMMRLFHWTKLAIIHKTGFCIKYSRESFFATVTSYRILTKSCAMHFCISFDYLLNGIVLKDVH